MPVTEAGPIYACRCERNALSTGESFGAAAINLDGYRLEAYCGDGA
jgi:hypothetical protein